MYVCVHRAPARFFQLAAGRVHGEALEIRGGGYHTGVVNPATFTWIGTINLCTRWFVPLRYPALSPSPSLVLSGARAFLGCCPEMDCQLFKAVTFFFF